MAQTSLIIGDTNWAVKEDSLLGYNVIQNNYLPIPIDCVRATTATRVNEQGLIEIVPRNLLLYSEQFDNANWGKINATVTTNTTTAPNGTLTADKLIATAVNGTHLVLQIGAGAVLGQNLTLSVYAKSAGLTRLQFVNNGGGSGISSYDLITGIATLSSGVSATMQDVGNGWYRCVLTFAPSATGNFNIQIRLLDSSGNSTFTGNDVDGIFAWGAQIDNGSVATEYFPTTNRLDIPRIDYSTGTASLLVEPQRTNLLTYSEQFNDASWAVNATITPNTTISPDGTQDADTILGTGFIGKNILQSGIHTFSVFAKAGTSNEIRLNVFDGTTDRGVYYNLSNGTITSSYGTIIASNIVLYSNGWYRISITTNNATRSYVQIHMDSAQTCFIWGAQLEAGSYATSYIPTIASSVTRNADVISRTGISSLIGQTEGTMFVDVNLTHLNKGVNEYLMQVWLDGSNRILIFRNTSNFLCYYFIKPGFTFNADSTVSSNGRHKIAFAYKSGNSAFYIDGVQIELNTTTFGAFSSLSIFDLGIHTASGSPTEIGDYPYNSVQLYKTRLTNSELAQLTTI